MTSKEIAKLYGAQCIMEYAPQFIDQKKITIKWIREEIDGWHDTVDDWAPNWHDAVTIGEIRSIIIKRLVEEDHG